MLVFSSENTENRAVKYVIYWNNLVDADAAIHLLTNKGKKGFVLNILFINPDCIIMKLTPFVTYTLKLSIFFSTSEWEEEINSTINSLSIIKCHLLQ